MSITLDITTVKRLVSPTGTNDPLVRVLFFKEFQSTLVGLSKVHQKLSTDVPELAEKTGFKAAFNALSCLPAPIQKVVLMHPSTAAWVNVAWDLIRRQAHLLFPELHIFQHLEEFGRFALAGAYLAEENFECRTWTNAKGIFSLPGTGVYFESLNTFPFRKVQVSLNQGELRLFSEGGSDEIPIAQHQIPRTDIGIEINAIDHELQLGGSTRLDYDDITESSAIKWQATLEEAWRWIKEADPKLATEMLAGVRAIIPVKTPAPELHISVTFENAPGLMALSWSSDVSVVVEALVHEYHHHKLYALMNLDPLLTGPTDEAVFYSPWRDDPRPLYGIYHGAYVFQAVLSFWNDLLETDIVVLQKARLLQRLFRVKKQVQVALRTLREQGTFSALGQALLDAMSDKVEAFNAPLLEEQPHIKAELNKRLDQHYADWKQRNPHLATQIPSKNVAALTTSFDDEEEGSSVWQRAIEFLEIESIDLSPILHLRSPYDPLLNRLLHVFHEQGLDELATELAEVPPGKALVQDLLVGHVAYLLNNFAQAARFYSSCLQHEARAPYLWQCFGFALRKMNRWEDSTLIINNIGSLISQAPLQLLPGSDLVEQRLDFVKQLLAVSTYQHESTTTISTK